MKELDRTKAYDLRDLNDEQLKELVNALSHKDNAGIFEHKDFINIKNHIEKNKHLCTNLDFKCWGLYPFSYWNREVINALTLFEPTLKIGDTFERDGFICEVKEPVKKWCMVTYNSGNTVYKRITKAHYEMLLVNYNTAPKEITDQEFIKQLEKYAK